ncbi:unnamed protein product [Calypogeia fissa]
MGDQPVSGVVSTVSGASDDTPLLLLDGNSHGGHFGSYHDGLSSVKKTFCNIVISVGVLGMPYTFKQSRWLSGSLALAFVGLASYYNMMLLVKSKRKLESEGNDNVHCHILGETQLGDNCVILSGAVVGADILGHTIIGDCNTIGHYAVVGVKCQDRKYKDGDECYLYIGNNNDIREFASVHRSSKPDDNTVVGNDNLIMGSCHVAHDCKIGNGNILANGTLLGGHVVVEDLVHTSGGVAVHQFCHIDSYAFLAGGSMVDRDVPRYMMVAGDRAELRGLNLEGM